MSQDVKLLVTLVGGPLCGVEDVVPMGEPELDVFLFRCRATRRVYAYEFVNRTDASGLWVLEFYKEVGGPL